MLYYPQRQSCKKSINVGNLTQLNNLIKDFQHFLITANICDINCTIISHLHL